jgi:hypothetical protein
MFWMPMTKFRTGVHLIEITALLESPAKSFLEGSPIAGDYFDKRGRPPYLPKVLVYQLSFTLQGIGLGMWKYPLTRLRTREPEGKGESSLSSIYAEDAVMVPEEWMSALEVLRDPSLNS